MTESRPRDVPDRLAALRQAIAEAAAGDVEAYERLVDVLAEIDAAADPTLARSALEILHTTPAVIARLYQQARRVLWFWSSHTPVITAMNQRVSDGTAGPIATVLASTHGDGRVRELAVARMLDAPSPHLTGFLVLRTAEWAKPVRDRARAGLALLLTEHPNDYQPPVLAASTMVDARLRGDFLRTQIVAALLNAPARLRDRLAGTGGRAQRRLVFDTGLSQGWWRSEDLVAAALREPDVHIRVRAAEAACRDRCSPTDTRRSEPRPYAGCAPSTPSDRPTSSPCCATRPPR